MEFSDMMRRCKLSELSNFLIGGGELVIEREDLDFEMAVKKAEKQTDDFLEEHFESMKERDEIFAVIADREAVMRETYFQMGFIAGINLSREIERKTKELNRKK